ncbi:MAG TPA: fused MFS/spermidine synthase [Planctomycetota bacterium]|nr:fused MFS/spermidine synthase [Planctomycetota bacterium]
MSASAKSENVEVRKMSSHHAGGANEIKPEASVWAARALYLIVFISGGVVLGVEVAGAKILAPGFGTSTFVWGSIIGMFMAALATGYYMGGVISDRRPSFGILAGIVAASGLWTAIFVPRAGPKIAESIAQNHLGSVTGPLLTTFAIFYIPSLLMGMVTPYAVKLNASSLSGLGQTAGRLYALSTAGSIIGTLLTTFVLIPFLHLSTALQMLGILQILSGTIGFGLYCSAQSVRRESDRTAVGLLGLVATVCIMLWAVVPVKPHMAPGQRLMHYRDSAYHEILVTEDVIASEGSQSPNGGVLMPPKMWTPHATDLPRGVREVRRWMKFNENIESGIYPYRNEHVNAVNYTDLLHLPLMWVKEPKKVLVVGAGGGVVPAQFFNWYGCEVDVFEIDPAVKDTALKYFQVPPTDKIKIHVGDGRQLMRAQPDKSYDIIFLDAYSSGGQIPWHIMTWEFLENVRSKLTDNGVLLTNIISGIRNVTKQKVPPAALFLSEYKTLKASEMDVKGKGSTSPLFNQLYVFPKVYRQRELTGQGYEDYRNIIVIATREEKRRTLDDLTDTIKELTKGEKPRVRPPDMLWHVEHIYEKGPTEDELKTVPILRDDYAPLDTMYRPVKRDESERRLWL